MWHFNIHRSILNEVSKHRKAELSCCDWWELVEFDGFYVTFLNDFKEVCCKECERWDRRQRCEPDRDLSSPQQQNVTVHFQPWGSESETTVCGQRRGAKWLQSLPEFLMKKCSDCSRQTAACWTVQISIFKNHFSVIGSLSRRSRGLKLTDPFKRFSAHFFVLSQRWKIILRFRSCCSLVK